ncbi:Apoptotic ATPase [Phytophthora cinnamomi]|uniref:Apoptotic ATPase n=1 Tax=Phytophthora cinnamomi TaxID=4785 RepID=UPI003559B08D|nr:Apoptotic ATPase [Phytophthora cinnamomi]
MQVWKFASVLALLALSQQVAAKKKSEDKDRPGMCEETEDCTADGYQCVALQTTRSDTETVKQCLPKEQDTDVCSGQYPGLCPTFSSWVSPYNQISSVCTYKPAEKCVTGSKSSSGEGVICVSGAEDSNGKSIDVIYGCVDFDTSALEVLFGEKEATKLADDLGTSSALIENCLSTNATSNSTLLCSGQGTCVPDSIGSLSYMCRCNVGYSGDFCDNIDSNKCQLPGQCATGVCNLDTQQCECAAGTTGDQCSECDATSDKACNGKGTCSNKKCECEDGWEGLQCTKESAKKKKTKSSSSKASSSESTTAATTSGAMPQAPLSYAAMAIATVLAAAIFN